MRRNAVCLTLARCLLSIALLSCVRVRAANDTAASQPTTRPREFHSRSGYQSQMLQDYDKNGAEAIRHADDEAAGAHRAAREALAAAYDLRRGDLLGIALGVKASDVRNGALYFLDDLSLPEQRAAVIVSLGDEQKFVSPKGIREQDEWGTFLVEYGDLVRDVCGALRIALPNGVPDLRNAEARADIRRLLIGTIQREELQGVPRTRLGLGRPGDPGLNERK